LFYICKQYYCKYRFTNKMATGGRYVDVPGKGKRFLTDKGEYRMSQDPLIGGIESFIRSIPQNLQGSGRFTPEQMRGLTAPGVGVTPPTNPLAGDPTGRYIPGSMQTRFANTETPTGNTDEYRQQLSQYSPKVFPQTPGGQFERYFQSPEMDQYFGAASRGKGAPGSVEAMTNLASQAKAPLDAPLASYYRAQSAAGRGAMPEVVGGLMQGLEGDKANAMKAWAEANPMLAYREFNKRKTAGDFTPMAPDGVTRMGDLGSRAQEEGGYTMPSFGQGVGNPVVPTQSRNASGMTQGEQMDANRGVTNLQAFQAAKTSGEGMPQFDTTAAPVSQKANDFLQRMGFGVNYQLK
jgi:hypothetical protein